MEGIIEKAIFLAPKADYLKYVNGDEVIKVKGLNASVINSLLKSDILNFNVFVELLEQDRHTVVNQHKSLKNLLDGSLDIIEQTYSIKHTSNKRELIYKNIGAKNILVDTKPKIEKLKKSKLLP